MSCCLTVIGRDGHVLLLGCYCGKKIKILFSFCVQSNSHPLPIVFLLRDCDCPTRFFVHFQQTAPTQSCQSKWKSNIYNIHTTWLHNPLLLHVPNKTEDSWKHVRGHVQEIVFCVFSKNNLRWVQVSEVSTHCFVLNLHFFPLIFNSMDVWPQSSMFAFANARSKIAIVNALQFVERRVQTSAKAQHSPVLLTHR